MPWTEGKGAEQSGLTVTYKKDVLVQAADSGKESAADYTVTYEHNERVGTASILLHGTGTDHDKDGWTYTGSKRINFKITGIPMTKVKVENLLKSYVYSGEEIRPFELSKEQNEAKEVLVSWQPGGKAEKQVLEEGIDYTISYGKNVDKGTAEIILKGVESRGFTGTKR